MNRFLSRLQEHWRSWTPWRTRVTTVILFCTAVIAGAATVIANVKSISEFLHLGQPKGTRVELDAQRIMFPVNPADRKGQVILLNLTIQKFGADAVRGCKFEAWFGNEGLQLGKVPYIGSFSIPPGNSTQEMQITLYRPPLWVGAFDVRLILSCNEVVSDPLVFAGAPSNQ
jgi:hypothetical protein